MKTLYENDRGYICDIDSPFFQMLSGNECDLLKSGKMQILFRKGDMLTKQGVFASYILLVIKGISKLYIEDNSGKNFNLHIALPGEFIGLSTVFDTTTFDYSVQAITECQALLIEKDKMKQVLLGNGQFATGIISRYCALNRILLNSVHCIQFKQMNGRLANALIYLNSKQEKGNELFSLLSRKDIAEFAGISVESTVKLLKSFESDGLIALDAKSIVIRNKEKLADIAERG